MDLLLGGLILTVILVLLTYVLYSNADGDSSIPYARYESYPIVGHLFAFTRNRTKLLLECAEKYGSCFRIQVFNQRFTIISSYIDWATIVRSQSFKFMAIESGINIFGLSPTFLGKYRFSKP